MRPSCTALSSVNPERASGAARSREGRSRTVPLPVLAVGFLFFVAAVQSASAAPAIYLPVAVRRANLAMSLPDPAMASRIGRLIDRMAEAYPPETIFRGYDPRRGGPSIDNAFANAYHACEDFPDLPDIFGPQAHKTACRCWITAFLGLYHINRFERHQLPVDRTWAAAYLNAHVAYLDHFVTSYGKDSLAGVWQNPLRAIDLAVLADLVKRHGALDPALQVRIEDDLATIARAWHAEWAPERWHPTTGLTLTTRTADEYRSYSLGGNQSTSTQAYTFHWDADENNSPSEELAWMGAGVMLAARVAGQRLPDGAKLMAYGQHYVDYALTFDRPDPEHGNRPIRTLNADTAGGAYGQRKYWIQNHGVDMPSLPYLGWTLQFIGTALFASPLGAMEPWPSLIPDDAQWQVMRAAGEETLKAPDDAWLVDFTPGLGVGYKLERYPLWRSDCARGDAGRMYARYDGRRGDAPLYVSEIGHPAGMDLVQAGWAYRRLALAAGDPWTFNEWTSRMNRTLDEYLVYPPSPYWSECGFAPYVSKTPGYHWARYMWNLVLAYLGTSGYEVAPWPPAVFPAATATPARR